jgi:hypothetical protein
MRHQILHSMLLLHFSQRYSLRYSLLGTVLLSCDKVRVTLVNEYTSLEPCLRTGIIWNPSVSILVDLGPACRPSRQHVAESGLSRIQGKLSSGPWTVSPKLLLLPALILCSLRASRDGRGLSEDPLASRAVGGFCTWYFSYDGGGNPSSVVRGLSLD